MEKKSINIEQGSEQHEPQGSDRLSELLKKVYGASLDTKLEFYPEDSWELVTIHFKEASVTISKEAKKLPASEITELIDGLRKYRDAVRGGENISPIGMGGAGSVYEISNKYLIKESTDVDAENDALQHSFDLQEVINSCPSFPSDIRIVHSIAIVEPPFSRKSIHGKKRYVSIPFPYDTIYGDYGEEIDIRSAGVEAYIVMPYIADSIKLEELLLSKGKDNPQREKILDVLLKDGLIEAKEDGAINDFISAQTEKILDALRDAQAERPAHERITLGDSSPKNILLRLERDDATGIDKIVYYKIDH